MEPTQGTKLTFEDALAIVEQARTLYAADSGEHSDHMKRIILQVLDMLVVALKAFKEGHSYAKPQPVDSLPSR